MKKTITALIALAVLAACGGGSPSGPSPVPVVVVPTPVPTPSALWERSGAGITVFDIPRSVDRVTIDATYTGRTSNFIVHIDGQHVVNELLGTAWGKTTFHATYLLGHPGGGTVETLYCDGVSWKFTEVR